MCLRVINCENGTMKEYAVQGKEYIPNKKGGITKAQGLDINDVLELENDIRQATDGLNRYIDDTEGIIKKKMGDYRLLLKLKPQMEQVYNGLVNNFIEFTEREEKLSKEHGYFSIYTRQRMEYLFSRIDRLEKIFNRNIPHIVENNSAYIKELKSGTI